MANLAEQGIDCMTNEDAYFEVWYHIHQHDEWTKLYGGTSMPPGWGEGFKSSMKAGWMARASFHVTYAAHKHVGSPTIDRGETCTVCGRDMNDPIHNSTANPEGGK
jgi:hypothetical protein